MKLLDWLRVAPLGPETWQATRRLFLALLGLTYACAFASMWLQVDGLIGSAGIAPAAELLDRLEGRLGDERLWRLPTLLWFWRSDAALDALCLGGAAAAVLAGIGFAPRLGFALCWLAYLSLADVGGIFFRYQWDSLLLEAGFLALFLAPGKLRPRDAARKPADPLAFLLLRFLLFKLMFMSGWVKLASGDETWRSLTAMDFHHWTQPLPAWTSWFANALPHPVQAASVLFTFAVELGLPFLVFAPRRLRWLAFAGLVLLQVGIGSTGSYGFFNLLSVALCVTLLDDASLRLCVPASLRLGVPVGLGGVAPPAERAPGRAWPLRRVALALAVAVLVAASAQAMLDRLGLAVVRPEPLREVTRTLMRFHAVGSYGLFAVMTTERKEIEIQGSHDGSEWKSYLLPYQPGPPDRRPAFAGFHMPRLDWQLWFASLRGCRMAAGWFEPFLLRLLQGEAGVRALVAHDPFPEAPPRYLRTRFWSYTPAPAGGDAWWERTELGRFCPTVTLDGDRVVASDVESR